jgi:hypothetical protein
MAMAAVQERFQQAQALASARNAGHVGVAIAGAIMVFVACPMSIVAIAAPYWTGSTTSPSMTVSSAASLWSISASVEGGSISADQSAGMCGDEMEGSNIDCGKIHSVRFFQITGLLLALASAAVLLVAFSPLFSAKRELRPKMYIAGACVAGVELLWNFLSFCLVASLEMGDPYSLNGAGFVFLILSSLLITTAIVIIVLVLRSEWPTVSTTPVKVIGAMATSTEKLPNLLEVNASEVKQVTSIGNAVGNDDRSRDNATESANSERLACEEP